MQLGGRGQPAKADQLFQRLLGVVQSWSTDTLLPLLNVSQQYVQYLTNQAHQRESHPETEAAAIDRYKSALIATHGAGTGHLAQVFRITLELERTQGRMEKAIQSGEELMAFQETLTGKTSDGYLSAMQTLAGLYEANQQWERSLPLRLQTVEIADLVSRDND